MRIPETATGEFEPGDPVTGKPGSRLSSAYMNSQLREILNILRAAGIAQSNDDDGQLLAAIRKLITTATAGVLPPVRGGTGLNYVPPGSYLIGNGTAAMTSRTPGQVLRDIGAIPVGGAVRHVYLTIETDANTLIDDNAFYVWSNRTVMGANFPRFKSVGYLRVYSMASDCVAQEISLVTTGRKPYCFHRLGNPAAGVWQPWKATSSFSAHDSMPAWDAGDIYVDGLGWHRWNGNTYVVNDALRKCSANALPLTNVGPVFVTEFGEIWSWVSTPSYTGYRSPNCGQIAYFAMDQVHMGWLKANGTEASRTAFAGIFSVIGTRYGAGDGVTTFGLPDQRGEFIRGWDDSRGVDSGRVVGSAQAATAIRLLIDNYVGYATGTFAIGMRNVDGVLFGEGGENRTVGSDSTFYVAAATARVGSNDNTAYFVRPRNVALQACIKI